MIRARGGVQFFHVQKKQPPPPRAHELKPKRPLLPQKSQPPTTSPNSEVVRLTEQACDHAQKLLIRAKATETPRKDHATTRHPHNHSPSIDAVARVGALAHPDSKSATAIAQTTDKSGIV